MKKMQNYIKMMIAVLVAFASTACSEYEEHPSYYPTRYRFYVRNQSSHTICVTDDLISWELQPNQIQEKLYIVDFGKSLIFHYTEGMDIGFEDEERIVFSGATKVVFDNMYEITHTDDMPHSLFNVASYSDMYNDYTYTFTDEDYDYAVANGVVLGDSAQ